LHLAATPGAPLTRYESWYFELRRINLGGVDKVDFLFIDTNLGEFKLKRANQHVKAVPYEFARTFCLSPAPTTTEKN
jgi:hypothetical protein